MRKIAYLSLSTVIALGAVGCSKNEKVADTKVLEINQEIQLLRNDIDKLNRKLRESNREIDSLEKINSTTKYRYLYRVHDYKA